MSICEKKIIWWALVNIHVFVVLQSTSETWRSVFYISAELYIFGVIIYTLLGSGELQSWAKTSDSNDYERLPQNESQDTDDSSVVTGSSSAINSYQNYDT